MSLNALLPYGVRRTFLASPAAARSYFRFPYPHSFQGVNNAYNNVPQKNQYPNIQRTFQPGEVAPAAHQNTRVFPEWYKPYMMNYVAEGYFAVGFFVLLLFGYSFVNDIKEQKGRKVRKVFDRGNFTYAKLSKERYAIERIEKGDKNFTKFLELKEKSHGHH